MLERVGGRAGANLSTYYTGSNGGLFVGVGGWGGY